MRLGLHFLAAFMIATGFAACNSDSPAPAAGPIDGTYVLASETCATANHPGGVGTTLTVANTSFSAVTPDVGGGCIITVSGSIVYSGSNHYDTAQTAKRCGSSCGGGQCMANDTVQATISGTYTLSGSTLTLDATNYICASDTGGGTEEDIKTLTKQ